MDALEPSARTRQTATALRRASSLLQRRLRRETVVAGLSPGRASLLAHLARADGPLTPGELAAADGLQPQSVTRLLADLEARGWVTRRRDERDGRQARIALSADGRDALTRDAEARDQWLAGAMTIELSPAERALLRAGADLMTRLCERPAPLTDDELPAAGVPILPTHDARVTRACLVPLGFEVRPGSDDGYLMLRCGGLELHYQHDDGIDPFATAAAAFAWVPDVDAFHRRALESTAVRDGLLHVLPPDDGAADADTDTDTDALRARWRDEQTVARIAAPEDKPWRVREVALFDPTNNLLRIGHPIGLNRTLNRRPTRRLTSRR
jgi:DNA-binding MarR family transcriptional regulator